jgi:hypothetical protein
LSSIARLFLKVTERLKGLFVPSITILSNSFQKLVYLFLEVELVVGYKLLLNFSIPKFTLLIEVKNCDHDSEDPPILEKHNPNYMSIFRLGSHHQESRDKTQHYDCCYQEQSIKSLDICAIQVFIGNLPDVFKFDNVNANGKQESLQDPDVDILLVNKIKQNDLLVRVVCELHSLGVCFKHMEEIFNGQIPDDTYRINCDPKHVQIEQLLNILSIGLDVTTQAVIVA